MNVVSFVSGHGFSRAERLVVEEGFSPCSGCPIPVSSRAKSRDLQFMRVPIRLHLPGVGLLLLTLAFTDS